jgi:hypothetical protein
LDSGQPVVQALRSEPTAASPNSHAETHSTMLLTPADVHASLRPQASHPQATPSKTVPLVSDSVVSQAAAQDDDEPVRITFSDRGQSQSSVVSPSLDYRRSSQDSLVVFAQPPQPLPQALEPIPTLNADQAGQREEGLRPIGEVGADIRPDIGELPADIAAPQFASVGEVYETMGATRDWGLYSFTWEAKGLCHGPLRFEEPNLERYGYSLGLLQPAVSAAHFFSVMPLLPYGMAANRARDCQYTLGNYRPGSYAPYRINRMPVSLSGAAAQSFATAGAFVIFP